jgi:hypothetical protein
VDGRSRGVGEGSGGGRRDVLVAAASPKARSDPVVAGSEGASGAGTIEGASVGDDAAATEETVAGCGGGSRKSSSAHATMIAITSMGIRTRGIVVRSMRGRQYFYLIPVPRFKRK